MPQPDPANALNAVRTLDLLLEFFGEHGEHWRRGTFNDGNGMYCLVGAIDHLRREHGNAAGGAAHYISAAVWPGREPEYYCQDRLVEFNDGCRSFKRIRAVLVKARALAQRDMEGQQPEIAAPPKRRPTPKQPADRQRPSAVIHADSGCTSAVIHA